MKPVLSPMRLRVVGILLLLTLFIPLVGRMAHAERLSPKDTRPTSYDWSDDALQPTDYDWSDE